MKPILHTSLPFTPWMQDKTRKLPGIQPVPKGEWLLRDEVFARQMAYRDELLKHKKSKVFRESNASMAAQRELLDLVISELDGAYKVDGAAITRPDGVVIPIGKDVPILTAGKLVQEDLILLQTQGSESVMTAAVLCFPASWTLDQKFGKGLISIHGIVDEYDADMAKRVQRMFDAIRPESPLWRANFMIYKDPDLFQPRLEVDPRKNNTVGLDYVRVERQTLRKLEHTGAVVFGIHSYVCELSDLPKDEQQGLLHAVSQQ